MARSRSPSKPLKVALAGAGMISRHHLIAWHALGGRVRLVALCDPDLGRAKARAADFQVSRIYADVEEMFAAETVDALDVAAPRETHAVLIEAAARRGVHVLCQKPLTPTLAEAEALYRRLDGRARVMAHENWRFRPWYRELGRWVAGGELGELRFASLSTLNSCLLPDANGRTPGLERQPFMANESRLVIAEALIHHLDVLRLLCGGLKVVDARTTHDLAEVRGETSATILLETQAGAPVVLQGSMAAPGYLPDDWDRLELIGSEASALLEEGELRLLGKEPHSLSYDAALGYQASFDGAIAHFVDCLASGESFETDISDNLETLSLVEQAYAAAGSHGARAAGQGQDDVRP